MMRKKELRTAAKRRRKARHQTKLKSPRAAHQRRKARRVKG
jgi:hypothetical protein